MKVLFVSNLFPDSRQPVRGLDNANLLGQLQGKEGVEAIRTIGVRPVFWPRWLPDSRKTRDYTPRNEDACLNPVYVQAPYIPKVGSRWNAGLMAAALREPMKRMLRDFKYDVVLGAWLFPDGCALETLCREMKKPLVLICQGSDAHQYLQSPVRREAILRACHGSGAIITRSGSLADLLIKQGLPKEKVRPVHNGVDPSVFYWREDPTERAEVRSELGLPLSRPLFLFVGNLLPVKNPMLLLRAWKARCDAVPKAEAPSLVMVGEGPMRREISEFVRRAGLEHAFRMTGRLASPAIARLMRASDLLCLSSHNEGLPNVILEAFASGLPVVATDVGGVSEVFEKSCLGQLIPTENVTAFSEAMERNSCPTTAVRSEIALLGSHYSWAEGVRNYSQILACTCKGFSYS